MIMKDIREIATEYLESIDQRWNTPGTILTYQIKRRQAIEDRATIERELEDFEKHILSIDRKWNIERLLSLLKSGIEASDHWNLKGLKENGTDALRELPDMKSLGLDIISSLREIAPEFQSVDEVALLSAIFKWYSIYGEEITAIIPTLDYTGNNKLYIHQQLYKALNAVLKTGVPAMGQLFATILDPTLRGKKRAGAEVQEGDETVDQEVRQRRRAISWLLQSMLTNLRVKETFKELGQWTTYPLALSWAAQDFQQEGLTAWCINYPVAGFMQLLRFGKVLNVFSDKIIIEMRNYKLLQSFVSTYFSRLYKNMGVSRDWTKTLLEMLYVEFNDDLIPRDLGGNASILKSLPKFWNTLMEVMPAEDFFNNWTVEEITHMMSRIQVLAFWLVYYQLAHTSTKTYFAQLWSKEPLAILLLDTKAVVPENIYSEILLSIFIEIKPVFKNKELYASHENVVIPYRKSLRRIGITLRSTELRYLFHTGRNYVETDCG
ncbi:hypothetical protein EYC80_006579 [Monilinia laxa]|uniref:Uncharacterized protein n=1 Tax=Monilinia laxa TaxID=61186 RepID=A0A5N6JV18_MONLA|nr:hypothetical protein EYC80_006579 [Monilinia laxa]